MLKTFDEVVLFARTGLNPRTNFKLGQGSNKYITIKNIHNNTLIVDESTDVIDDDALALIHRRSQIKKGDLLFCSIGRMGDMYIIEDDPVGWDINESVFAFTLDTRIIRQKYFYYVFKNHDTIEYLSKNSSGSTFKSIKMNQLKKMVFDLPSLEEQDQIVAVLDWVTRIIEERQEELAALDDLIKARFVELMEKSDLSDETTIDSITERVKVGFVGTCEKYYTDESGIPMLRTGNITEKGIDLSDLKYVTDEFHVKNKKSQIHSGDLLIARHGSNGQANVYFGPDAQCLNAVVIVPNQEIASSVFLAGLINSPAVKRQIERTLVGSTQHVVNTKSIAGLIVRLPSVAVQKQYETFVAQIDKSKDAIKKSLVETQTLFDSLMQQYFG